MNLKHHPSQARVVFIIFVLCLVLLTSCNGGSFYTGVQGDAGPVSIQVTADSNGSLVFAAQITLVKIGTDKMGASWFAGYQQTIIDAKKTINYLYILWKTDYGSIYREKYNIGKPFSISFKRNEWVKKMTIDENHNVIVVVEKQEIDNDSITWANPTPANNNNFSVPQKSSVDNCRADYLWLSNVAPSYPSFPPGTTYTVTLTFYNGNKHCSFYNVTLMYGWDSGIKGPSKINIGDISPNESKTISMNLTLPSEAGSGYSITYNVVSNVCGKICPAITIDASVLDDQNQKKKKK